MCVCMYVTKCVQSRFSEMAQCLLTYFTAWLPLCCSWCTSFVLLLCLIGCQFLEIWTLASQLVTAYWIFFILSFVRFNILVTNTQLIFFICLVHFGVFKEISLVMHSPSLLLLWLHHEPCLAHCSMQLLYHTVKCIL